METLKPTETLERHISQKGITIGPQKLEIFKRALALRGTWVIHSQENTEDPTVFVKLFDPWPGPRVWIRRSGRALRSSGCLRNWDRGRCLVFAPTPERSNSSPVAHVNSKRQF